MNTFPYFQKYISNFKVLSINVLIQFYFLYLNTGLVQSFINTQYTFYLRIYI